MNWITKEEVRKAAAESELAAVQCSRKHWEQLNQAIPTELAKGFWSGKTNIGTDYCALCIRNGPNRPCPCPLKSCADGTVYRAADNAINALKVSVAGSGLVELLLLEEWQKASKAMTDRLAKIERELSVKPTEHYAGRMYLNGGTLGKYVLIIDTDRKASLMHVPGGWIYGMIKVAVTNPKHITNDEFARIAGSCPTCFEPIKENKDDRG